MLMEDVATVVGGTHTHIRESPWVPVNPNHLYNNICTKLNQRRRRWAGVVQKLYKCFVFAGVLGVIFCDRLKTIGLYNNGQRPISYPPRHAPPSRCAQ